MTIYRGPGGTGSASSDSDTTEFQEFLVQSQAARDAAQAAQAAAEAAEAAAEAAAGDVDAGVAASAASATAAAGSASSAATSATNASSSASSASTSASNAASSASSASTSASSASTSATNAGNSATAAASSATAASGSATSAASSAATATTQASNASSSASAAATSATNASNSATASASSATASANSASSSAASAAAAALALDNFDDRYLGVKTAAPTLDNDGNALVAGALYFNSGAVTPDDKGMWVYDGGTWIAASAASQAIMVTYEYVATQGQTTFTGADANGVVLSYTAGSIVVTLNGVKLRPGNDYTASTGNSVVLAIGAAAGDDLVVDAFATFDVANTYTQAQVDGFAVKLTGDQTIAGVKTFSSAPVMGVTGLTGNIAADRIKAALNASNGAPIYACRAWVNFNGTGTVAIRASGNVSSITDNGVGNYTVNFTTAMPDANYSVSFSGSDLSWGSVVTLYNNASPSTTAAQVRVAGNGNSTAGDPTYVCLTFFR